MISSKYWLVIILLTVSTYNVAQVGIGTTNPKAVLDINSASSGILMPRLTTKERLAIENPAQALTVYDLDLGCFTFWHNNQWHCLCGENDVILPKDDWDDDDDGIRDTDEIANCIANGEDVIFTVTDVPDNYTEQYYTVKGNYFTNCGVGTWTFEKPKFIPDYGTDEINFTYFANNDEDDNSKPVGIINDNKQVYFNFNTTKGDEFKLYGIFTFNGPPIIPVIEGYSGYQYDEDDKYRAEIDKISFTWNENTKGKYYDPNTDLNKGLHNKTYESGEPFDIREIYGNKEDKNPYHRQQTWHIKLGETSSFVFETGTNREIKNLEANKAEGFGLRAIATSSTNYSFNDNDGIASSLDIDSDNDGIYDLVEAGFKAYDTNGDGILNSNDNGYLDTNNNGMHDSLENLTPKDTNGNGVLDAYELDADGDTCLDVYEAGFTDTDNDGDLDGTGIDNSNGKVTGNTDGYTNPGTTFQNANFCKECGESSEYEYDSGTSGDIIFEPKEFVTIEDENGNPVDVINSLKININVNGEKQIKIKHRVDNGYKVPIHINKIDINITNNTGQVKFSPTGNWPYPIHTNCEITFNGVSMTPGVNQGRLKYDSNILKEPSIINNGYSCEDVNADCN